MVAVAGHRLGNRCLWPFSAGAQGPFSSSALYQNIATFKSQIFPSLPNNIAKRITQIEKLHVMIFMISGFMNQLISFFMLSIFVVFFC